MAKLKYFKCNVIGGFRLSDLNRNVKQGEVVGFEDHVKNTSKAVQAAINVGWLIKTKSPKKVSDSKDKDDKVTEPIPKNANKSLGMSVPDAKQVNKNLEARQAEEVAKKIPMPDFKEVAKPKKAESSSGVSIPDIRQAQKNAYNRQGDNLTNKDEIIKTVIVKQVDTIEDLVIDEKMNEGLSVPDFDEKGEEIEDQPVGKKVTDRTIDNKDVVDETVNETEVAKKQVETKVDSKKVVTKVVKDSADKLSKDEQPKTKVRRKRTVA